MVQLRRWAGTGYRYLMPLFVAAVVVQFFLAGAGVFRAKRGADEHLFESSSFDAHRALGDVLLPGSLLLLLLIVIAWSDRRTIVHTAVLFLLTAILQPVLSGLGEDSPWVAALHAVNGLVILALASLLAHRAWRQRRAERPPLGPATAT